MPYARWVDGRQHNEHALFARVDDEKNRRLLPVVLTPSDAARSYQDAIDQLERKSGCRVLQPRICSYRTLTMDAKQYLQTCANDSPRMARWHKLSPPTDTCYKYLGIILLLAICGMCFLAYQNATYDVDYDLFLDNYAVLGLSPSASFKEVKSAFRALAQKWYVLPIELWSFTRMIASCIYCVLLFIDYLIASCIYCASCR